MNRLMILGSLIVILSYACQRETEWATMSTYPDGQIKIEQEFYMEGEDSIFVFQRIYGIKGVVQLAGALENGERHGIWQSFYPDGTSWSKTEFDKGIFEGETTTWYKNGIVRYTGFYKNGKEDGEWRWYDSTGTFIRKVEFDEGVEK